MCTGQGYKNVTQYKIRDCDPRSQILSSASTADLYQLKSDSMELAVHLHWELSGKEATHIRAGYCEQMDPRNVPDGEKIRKY